MQGKQIKSWLDIQLSSYLVIRGISISSQKPSFYLEKS